MLCKHPKLYQDPHIHYPEYNMNLGFADYITQCKKIVANTRQDLQLNAEKIIDLNSPFELHPQNHSGKKQGVLLVQGLLDSPFMMKDIGNYLQSQGLLVRSLLLPGHGTVPGALLNIRYQDWLQSVRYGVASFSKEVDKLFIAGFSTGATASVYQTLHDNLPIAGIISIAAADKINSALVCTSNLPPLLFPFWERAAWMGLAEENDYAKYCSITYNAAYQVYLLSQASKKIRETRQLTCPIFCVLSHDDKIVSSSASLRYFLNNKNPESQMIYYTNQPLDSNDARIMVRNSAYPEQHILNFSHIALPLSPNNPHYGKQGDYAEASHVDTDTEYDYCDMDRPLTSAYNVLYRLNILKKPRKRLTFNPDFDFMMQKISEFILSK